MIDARPRCRGLLWVSLLLLVGCGDVTSLMVEVTSDDLSVPVDVDGLRFEVESESGRSVDQTFAIQGAWPHSLAVLPASSQDGTVTVTVTGLLGGTPVVRRVVRSAFLPGVERRVEVRLDRACLGLPCGDGVDCVQGVCAGVDSDGGVGADGGVDGGTSERDGGAGDPDGGSDPDGGVDAGSGMDAGTDAGVDAGSDAGPLPDPVLLITEYVEGSSRNKALEIQNRDTLPFDLSRCELQRFSNGSTSAFDIPLSGTLGAGDFYVICDGSIEITTACDELTGSLNHNGDDALVLVCDGAVIDSFGQIGVDPPVVWTGGGLSTEDHVLTRRCAVTTGDTDGSDAFDPSIEWQGAEWSTAAASLTGLGNRAECP